MTAFDHVPEKEMLEQTVFVQKIQRMKIYYEKRRFDCL